jgi:hypothetical protein
LLSLFVNAFLNLTSVHASGLNFEVNALLELQNSAPELEVPANYDQGVALSNQVSNLKKTFYLFYRRPLLKILTETVTVER